MVLLFWTMWSVYRQHQRDAGRLVNCDACCPVYAAGRHRVILEERRAGADTALFLVVDDRIELGWAANEIHQVDLATGEGRLLRRLPPGVFISDIDWSPGPAGE